MNLVPITERLVAGGVPNVEGVSALAVMRARPPQFLPAAYVVAGREAARAPRALVGRHDQLVDCSFSVLLFNGVTPRNPQLGDTEIERHVRLVEELLTGWVHPDADGTATALAAIQLLEIAEARVVTTLDFQTVRRITKNITQ
jgi:hypothetical protein